MSDVRVRLGSRSYTVHIHPGLCRSVGTLCRRLASGRNAALVTSAAIGRRYAARVEHSLQSVGFRVYRIVISDGERAKTPAHVARLHNRFAGHRLERNDPIVVLGGGTLGDAAGFAAATYLRGVPLVHVPTTLMAQVDSAVGGKTGVNLAAGKNLVGAIWQPVTVICDTETLASLPRREVASGLAEVVKYGLIARPAILTRLERSLARTSARPEIEPSLVAACVRIKARVVEADERELGLRRILNFGHTLGHAFENAQGYRKLTHGEAVAMGMLVALELSCDRLRLAAVHRDRVFALLRRIFPQLAMPRATFRQLDRAMSRDKKVKGGRRMWVLLKEPGDPVIAEVRFSTGVERALESARHRWAACV